MGTLFSVIPFLMRGLLMTIVLCIGSLVISLILGTIFGLFTCSRVRGRLPLVARCIDCIAFVLRSVPFYVQLLLWYFVLPDLIGIALSPISAAIGALGICSAAYVINIVSTVCNSVSPRLWEAAYVLGYTPYQTVRYVIVPSVLPYIIPQLLNEVEHIIKSTAVISSIGIIELTRSAMNIISRGGDPLILYGAVAALYVLISTVITSIGIIIRRKLKYDNQ